MQFPDEKDLDIKVYMEMADEYETYAREKGLSDQEAALFVQNSISNSVRSKYRAIYATKDEIEERIAEIFRLLGLTK